MSNSFNDTPSKLNRKRVGEIGESAAAAYLKHKGHEVLGRNIRLRRGEVDILTKKDKTLHVVEVKTSVVTLEKKLTSGLILPEDMFSKKKISRLKYLANVIMVKYSNREELVQIDGIAVRIYKDGGREGAVKITARFYEGIS